MPPVAAIHREIAPVDRPHSARWEEFAHPDKTCVGQVHRLIRALGDERQDPGQFSAEIEPQDQGADGVGAGRGALKLELQPVVGIARVAIDADPAGGVRTLHQVEVAVVVDVAPDGRSPIV